MMKQHDYWNQVAATKQFTTPFQADVFAQYVEPSAQILDVGCGYGRTLHQLATAGFTNLLGVDFAEEMIQRGQNQYPDLDLRVMAPGVLPLATASCDAVILFAVLTCIANDQDQEQLITEIQRVLKPGGILYVNDFLLNSDARNQQRYQQYKSQHGGPYGVFELPEGAVCRHHDPQWIKHLLHSFTQLEYHPLTFTTMNGHQSNGFYYLGRNK